MGRGKGKLKGFVFKAKKGRILLEFYSFLNSYITKQILRNIVSKVSVRCCIKVLPHSFYRIDWYDHY